MISCLQEAPSPQRRMKLLPGTTLVRRARGRARHDERPLRYAATNRQDADLNTTNTKLNSFVGHRITTYPWLIGTKSTGAELILINSARQQ